MIHAYCDGRYLQNNEDIRISLGGRTIELVVDRCIFRTVDHRYAAADLFEFLGLSADDAVGLDEIYAEAKRLPSKKRRTTLIDLFVAFKAKRRDYARALELAGQAA